MVRTSLLPSAPPFHAASLHIFDSTHSLHPSLASVCHHSSQDLPVYNSKVSHFTKDCTCQPSDLCPRSSFLNSVVFLMIGILCTHSSIFHFLLFFLSQHVSLIPDINLQIFKHHLRFNSCFFAQPNSFESRYLFDATSLFVPSFPASVNDNFNFVCLKTFLSLPSVLLPELLDLDPNMEL